MKTLFWFYIVFGPFGQVGEPVMVVEQITVEQCETLPESYSGPVGNLPGYRHVFAAWCE